MLHEEGGYTDAEGQHLVMVVDSVESETGDGPGAFVELEVIKSVLEIHFGEVRPRGQRAQG